MRKYLVPLVIGALALAIAAGVGASSGVGDRSEPYTAIGTDNLPNPLQTERAARLATALEQQANGKIAAGKKVAKVGKAKFVELAQERNDRVFVIIADFSDAIHPSYPWDSLGPQHNEIAEPNRAVDNTTIWQPDFNKAHYEDMYFNKMVKYYKAQSSGRYTLNGSVIDWVRVPFNEARYGSNFCGSNVCSTVWYLIRDAVNQWVADQKAAGRTNAQIKADLDTFDVWDRYDADGDSNFDEPDSYIDHFQIVHAGEGEETGGGAQGANAIWSHRWYAAYQGIGTWGPGGGGGMQFGGTGTFANGGGPNALGMWVGDYTIQPENGGLGVFAHEYAHDLGLPDQYDTQGGENSTGFWTIMSSGSYLGDGTTDIGSKPGDFNAWEKLQLGWLSYETAKDGKKSHHKLGPSEFNTKEPQAVLVNLPDKEVTTVLAAPYVGAKFYYSGAGDNLHNLMTKPFTLPAGAVGLSAKVNFDIEDEWDYAYLTVGGTPIHTNLSSVIDLPGGPNDQNAGEGITGTTGGNWVTLTADLSAFAGMTKTIGFEYVTDGAVVNPGFMVDEIMITGQPTDGAETDTGWTFDGFSTTTGTETSFHYNAYIVENRNYISYDEGLKTGPYNFGFLNTKPDWVEHFPYQDGILISYWDTSFTDNNTSQHPGGGLILPIDSHPTALVRSDGVNPPTKWRARVQAYDSTFGKEKEKTDAITLHVNGFANPIPSLPGVDEFNDSADFWDPSTPFANVITPNTGTQIKVKHWKSGDKAEIEVTTPKKKK